MSDIVLSTLNARYAHASLGLRYLRANLAELHDRSQIAEFVIGQRTEDIAEQLLELRPSVIGLGIYIWNVEESTRLVALIKTIAPEVIVVLGGPEVSFETDQQRICELADYVITGWGDVTFAQLARQLLAGERPEQKIIPGVQAPLPAIALPYAEYTDEDVQKRYLYVEASRGCPFKCEFCLSSLDKTAWPFPLDDFLAELESLYARGARQFKFVDRTFNLKVDASIAILDFFLDKLALAPDDPPFIHFELIPDHLPERLKSAVVKFPPGTLQFEIGIQSFDPEVQARVSRRQKNDVAKANLSWLRDHTQAHLHVDLIAGLPGETVEQFAAGFDQLVALAPQEIQFGILKRLRGAPIARHTATYGLRFSPDPPYAIVSSDIIDFSTMQRLTRFSRFWDIIANSGRYPRTLPVLLGKAPFDRFMAFSDWLYQQVGQSHGIARERLVHLLHEHLLQRGDLEPDTVCSVLADDYHGSGGRSRLRFESADVALPRPTASRGTGATPKRQAQHLAGRDAVLRDQTASASKL